MSWSIEWTSHALREMSGLEPIAVARVTKSLERAAADPRRRFLRLKGSAESRLRVGDLRVVVRLDFRNRTIRVDSVRHRRNVYDR